MKKLFILASFLLVQIPSFSAEEPSPDVTVPFAVYGEDTLSFDVYLPKDDRDTHYCVIYSYGGGFIERNQREISTMAFCRRLADEGYVAIASDYRRALNGVKIKGSLAMTKPLSNAIGLAVEDVYKIVALTLTKAEEWKVNPAGIVLCGSSAGAITSLQCDYELCNRTPVSAILPDDFRFAGIISFAGAVLSCDGRCKFRVHDPAPVLLLHGTKDNLVPYDKRAFAKLRFSGSNDLVKSYARGHLPHEIIRFVGEGHGVAVRHHDNFDDVTWFIENMVGKGRRLEIDKTVYDHDHVVQPWEMMTTDDLYAK